MAVSGAASHHDAIFWASDKQLAVRRGNWKLVKDGKNYDGAIADAKPPAGDDALFLSNVDEDPGESKNLRHQNPEKLDELLTMAEKWLEDVKKP
jgi:arylsulfatase A-like enzyme